MSLKTRIDSKSKSNNLFLLKDSLGNTIAEVRATGEVSSTLEVATLKGYYIEKPNGWNSNKGE